MEELPFGITIASNVIAMAIGIALFLIALTSIFRTIVIPRSLTSTLSQLVMASVLFIAHSIARFRRTYKGRDAVLAWAGPSFIFVILVTWLGLFIVAYGFMIYAVSPTYSLADGLRQSGSSLLTLGFASSPGSEQTVIDFLAALTGPIVIALMIGVLPTIYSLYLERERPVTMLSSAAGEPAWGPEFLVRISLTGSVDALPEHFEKWSQWCASVRLSHMTYPMLIHVRSATAYRNYVVALLSILDAAALKLACNATLVRAQAFAVLLNGSVLLERLYEEAGKQKNFRGSMPMARRWRHSVHPHAEDVVMSSITPQMHAAQTAAARDAVRDMSAEDVAAIERSETEPITITKDEFKDAYDMIKESGFPVDRDLDDAWVIFQATRKRYEFAAYGLTELLDAAPAPWSGPRKIPTPVVWPNLSIPILREQQANEGSPDGSSDPPAPDAAHQ